MKDTNELMEERAEKIKQITDLIEETKALDFKIIQEATGYSPGEIYIRGDEARGILSYSSSLGRIRPDWDLRFSDSWDWHRLTKTGELHKGGLSHLGAIKPKENTDGN